MLNASIGNFWGSWHQSVKGTDLQFSQGGFLISGQTSHNLLSGWPGIDSQEIVSGGTSCATNVETARPRNKLLCFYAFMQDYRDPEIR